MAETCKSVRRAGCLQPAVSRGGYQPPVLCQPLRPFGGTLPDTDCFRKRNVFLSLRQKSKIFATSLVRGRHPLRKPVPEIRPCAVTEVHTRRDEGIPPYGEPGQNLPPNDRFRIVHRAADSRPTRWWGQMKGRGKNDNPSAALDGLTASLCTGEFLADCGKLI